jgi:hypothetical protein
MVAKFSKIWRKFSDKKSRKQALNNPTNNDRQEAPRDATSPPAAPTNPEVTFNEDSDSLRRAIASPLFKAEPVNGEIAAINLERARENESERPEENASGDITKGSAEKTSTGEDAAKIDAAAATPEIAPETAAGEIAAYDVSDEYASSDTAKSDKQTNQSDTTLSGSHPPCTRSKEGVDDDTEVVKRVSIINTAATRKRVTKYIKKGDEEEEEEEDEKEEEKDLLPLVLRDIASNKISSHLPTDVSASQSIRIVTPIQGVYLVSSPTAHMMITKTESSTPATKMMLLTLMSLQMFIEHMAFVLEWMVDRPIGIPLGSWLRNYLGPLSY